MLGLLIMVCVLLPPTYGSLGTSLGLLVVKVVRLNEGLTVQPVAYSIIFIYLL